MRRKSLIFHPSFVTIQVAVKSSKKGLDLTRGCNLLFIVQTKGGG